MTTRDEVVHYVNDLLTDAGYDRAAIDAWWQERHVELDGRSAETLLRIGYTRVVRELAQREAK